MASSYPPFTRSIISTVPPIGNRPGGVERWIKRSLKELQLDYVDLYLVHTPFTFVEVNGEFHPVNDKGEIQIDLCTDHIKVWSEMEKQVAEGRTKAIGLSNFNIEQINRIISKSTLPISNLQIELHVYFQQKELVEYCKRNGITVTAYSPLGTRGLVKTLKKLNCFSDLLTNPVVLQVAKRRRKTPAQVLLRHILQKDIAAIPKSSNTQRIKENFNLFDWELDAIDMSDLNALDQGSSARICNFSFFNGVQNHPEFPF